MDLAFEDMHAVSSMGNNRERGQFVKFFLGAPMILLAHTVTSRDVNFCYPDRMSPVEYLFEGL
jgi:hypothetical protein